MSRVFVALLACVLTAGCTSCQEDVDNENMALDTALECHVRIPAVDDIASCVRMCSCFATGRHKLFLVRGYESDDPLKHCVLFCNATYDDDFKAPDGI